MDEPATRPPVPPDLGDPNLDNPYHSPLEPYPHDPFVIPDDANPMPVEHPTPGGVPPAPVTDQ